MKVRHLVLLLLLLFSISLSAQNGESRIPGTWVVYQNDTIPFIELRSVHVFSAYKFKDEKQWREYTKLVRDVKKAYPYARQISYSIIESYEYMQTLPDEKTKQKYLEDVQKYMMDEYKPKMKKMTSNQGKILVKLVDRECNTTSYEIVKSLVGSVKATVYNTFAGIFGNSLKTRYDPYGKDAAIEEIVIQIEEGTVDYYYSQLSTYYMK